MVVSHLGLKGPLQRAEGPGGGDDRGKARHGWRVGVEELEEEKSERRREDDSVYR